MATAKKKKKKPAAIEMTLWNVILSYPDLHDPKPYKGKIYYRTDILLEKDHPQLKELRMALKSVKIDVWGDDETEWPEKGNPYILNGDEREDQPGYADRRYVTASTQTPVPVVDPKGKTFNPQMVKGGMFANVAVRISGWEFDGDVGVSIYLQGVQIDTSKPSLNFGGGKSVKQMFSRDDDDADDSDSDDTEESDDEDEDDRPRGKAKPSSKKRPARDEDEDDDADSDDGDDAEEDEDDQPRKKKVGKKKPSRNFDEDDED
jgi:hypothetical protein